MSALRPRGWNLRHRPRKPLAERLFALVRGPWRDPAISEDDCWPFEGQWRSRFGYGRIEGEDGQPLVAHRALYEMLRGPIPPGLIARHRCNTPRCCNPDHILPGTHQENYLDELAAGYPPLPERRLRARIA